MCGPDEEDVEELDDEPLSEETKLCAECETELMWDGECPHGCTENPLYDMIDSGNDDVRAKRIARREMESD